MAGSINLSLAQQFDKTNGKLLSGGRLYTFSAGTTTPQNVYKDQALTLAYPNPIELDSSARIPAFYVADGSLRARLVNSAGVIQFDTDNILVVGPSSGGGGGSSVDATTIFQTGDPLWVPTTGVRSGWIRCNGLGIGSATSGALQRSNSDCQALYLYLWGEYSSTLCPVAGGKGLTAAADWAANKAIATLDLRNVGPFGLPDMGNTDTGAFAAITFEAGGATNIAGSRAGAATKTLAVGEIPVITPAGSVAVAVTGNIGDVVQGGVLGSGTGSNGYYGLAHGPMNIAATAAFTGSPFGGGGAFDKLPPMMLGTWYMKL